MIRSIARDSTGLTLYASAGTAWNMYRKFSAYERSLRGYMNGWPIEYLCAQAAIVGTLAISRNALMRRLSGSWMSRLSW